MLGTGEVAEIDEITWEIIKMVKARTLCASCQLNLFLSSEEFSYYYIIKSDAIRAPILPRPDHDSSLLNLHLALNFFFLTTPDKVVSLCSTKKTHSLLELLPSRLIPAFLPTFPSYLLISLSLLESSKLIPSLLLFVLCLKKISV